MIISLYTINRLIVTVETGGVVCELGTEVSFAYCRWMSFFEGLTEVLSYCKTKLF